MTSPNEEKIRELENTLRVTEETVADMAREIFELNKIVAGAQKTEELLRNDEYIFESPDGGDTIYRRKFGESKREKIK